jgi:Reverse transcriptase (RNA-dependent DNA polymerase)
VNFLLFYSKLHSQKIAVILPLLKKNGLDSTQPSNFRPIANLPFMSKILERIVDHQLTAHLTRNNALPVSQSAYLVHRSTETALLRIHSDICSHLDSSNAVLLGTLDMSTAFDTVDHDILLQRLSTSYGITGPALKWIASYLSGRTCFVLVLGKSSKVYALICGVPQGSVLGPKFFILYTADLEALVTKSGFAYHSFADDTQIYKACVPTLSHAVNLSDDFTACFAKILLWMKVNRLQLNPDKTECIWFRSPRCDLQDFPNLIAGTAVIQPAEHIRSLGVYLDQHLRFDRQINAVSRACYFQLRQIKTVIRKLDSNAIRSLLQAFLSIRIDYCNSLYFNLPSVRTSQLQRIQNSAARLYSGTKIHDHISPVLQELHWLPVTARISYKVAVIAFQLQYALAPPYLSALCQFPSDVHDHLLRSVTHNDFAAPHTMTHVYGNRTLSRSVVSVWNSLPVTVRSLSSLPSFRRQLKTFYFRRTFCI